MEVNDVKFYINGFKVFFEKKMVLINLDLFYNIWIV